MTARSRKRVVVMISGRGSNMAALIGAAEEAGFPAEIVGVISDKPGAAGLELARQKSIETRVIPRADYADKAGHEAAIEAELSALGCEILCLAGYMRLLSPEFVTRWLGRMINIHPSLLPSFRGLETHGRALSAGVRIHGCTVHFVTAEVDEGPIIVQAAVPVLSEDDEASLAQRVLKAEHQIYPLGLRLVAEGKAVIEDGKCRIDGILEREPRTILVAPDIDNSLADLERLARFTP